MAARAWKTCEDLEGLEGLVCWKAWRGLVVKALEVQKATEAL